MSGLPRISGREAAKALGKVGYEFDRQRGSHMVLRYSVSPFRRVVVPDHKEIAKGALRELSGKLG